MKQKTSTRAVVICLLLAASFAVIAATGLYAQSQESPGRNETNYRISGPYTHKNLTIFLVHGKELMPGKDFLTLQEALAQKKVIVYETKDVNELAIRNLSSQDVYVQAGDMVRGGEQDRMISVDFIVPPKSGRMPIAAFCVESGRWSKRGNEAPASFSSSENYAATKDLKLAAKRDNSQQAVWENVKIAQEKLSQNVSETVQVAVSASSLELSLGNSKVKQTTAAYIKALSGIVQNKSDVIGYVFAINGHVNSADVYASRALFVKLWPKLLKASAVEAVAELQAEAKPQPVDDHAVKTFLAESEQAKAAAKEVTQRVRLVTREDEKNIFFETQDRQEKDGWVHRNYIRKQ
jgi:hypothetical protein